MPSDIGLNQAARTLGETLGSGVGDGLNEVAIAINHFAIAHLAATTLRAYPNWSIDQAVGYAKAEFNG